MYVDPTTYQDLADAVREFAKELDRKWIELETIIGGGMFKFNYKLKPGFHMVVSVVPVAGKFLSEQTALIFHFISFQQCLYTKRLSIINLLIIDLLTIFD